MISHMCRLIDVRFLLDSRTGEKRLVKYWVWIGYVMGNALLRRINTDLLVDRLIVSVIELISINNLIAGINNSRMYRISMKTIFLLIHINMTLLFSDI